MDPMGVLLSCIHQHLLRRAKTIWTYLDLKHQTHKKWIWPRPPQPTKCNKNTVVLNSKEMKRMRCKSSHEKTTNKSGFWYGSGYSLRPLKSTKKNWLHSRKFSTRDCSWTEQHLVLPWLIFLLEESDFASRPRSSSELCLVGPIGSC